MTPPNDTITIVSTPSCFKCKLAARYLTDRGIPFNYIDATTDPEWAAWMAELGLTQVPQTVKGDQRVEGLDFDSIARLFWYIIPTIRLVG